MLHEFIATNRNEIIQRCRMKVAARSVPAPTEETGAHGVPVFLEQLEDALRGRLTSSADIAQSALQHGHELLLKGFTVSQVVHDYGDVCQAITELAVEMDASISTDDFRMLNGCLDDAIAGAVTEFGREQNQSTLEEETTRGNERAGFVAHEMRNLLNTALLAFEVLKTGNVGVGGSTGTVLHRSLLGARALTGRSLAEVRLAQGVQNHEQFLVAGFIEELAPGAAIEGNARGIALTRAASRRWADRRGGPAGPRPPSSINLLQNAFKFTRPGTTVVLRVGASLERVLIEVEDECGGLPSGNVNELFRPFEQRGRGSNGVGPGSRLQSLGRRTEQRPHLCAQPP